MDAAEIQEVKQKIVEAGKYILEKGLVHGKSGNISVRIDENRVAITPSALPYPMMTPESILILDLEGNIVEGDFNPSSEAKMHLAIYKVRPDVNSVVHTHSVYASALACCRKRIPVFLDEAVPTLGGAIEISEYGMPGSFELADGVAKSVGQNNAALVANHGVVACGPTLEKAIHNVEFVERIAKMYIMAKVIGEPINLSDEVIAMEREIFEALNR